MPGYRRRYVRRGRGRRGRGRRGGGFGRMARNAVGAWSLAKSALAGVRYLRGLVNSEMYKYDLDVTPTVDTTGTVTHLTGIAVGDGDNQRTGNSIFVRGMYIRFSMKINAVATASLIRILLVRDRQQVADTVPTIADVLEAVTPNAPLNSNSVGKYDILWDRVVALQLANLDNKFLTKFIPCRSHVRFNGTAGTDIQRNGVYLMIFSNDANAPTVTYSSRITYHDN